MVISPKLFQCLHDAIRVFKERVSAISFTIRKHQNPEPNPFLVASVPSTTWIRWHMRVYLVSYDEAVTAWMKRAEEIIGMPVDDFNKDWEHTVRSAYVANTYGRLNHGPESKKKWWQR